jgi:lysophospholipase L1-like esterase
MKIIKNRQYYITNIILFLVSVIFIFVVYKERVDLHRQITNKLGGPNIAFIGDSITNGGGVWDWKLGKLSFKTGNFGQDSAGIQVVSWFVKTRIIPLNHITTVSIMAGTNDGPGNNGALTFNGDYKSTLAEYILLIQYMQKNNVKKIIITSTPPQIEKNSNNFIKNLNSGLKKYAQSNKNCVYIDLWPILSDGEKIRPEMTTDGVHFSSKAYSLWGEQLKKHI